jgi:6-pyruvoyltetrahydropterin/6-carboxytetrahydropterin synthase
MGQISITKIFEFAAAHRLPYHKGLCKNLHGHNYRLEVTISSSIQKEGAERGMIMDFGELKAAVKWVLLNYDHCNLNKKFDNPTAEIMIKVLAREIQQIFDDRKLTMGGRDTVVTKVRLWETSTSYTTWEKA